MTTNETRPPKAGWIVRLWRTLWMPSSRYSLAALVVLGGAGGVIFWGGFNTVMEATNKLEFCVS